MNAIEKLKESAEHCYQMYTFIIKGILKRTSETDHMFGNEPSWYQNMEFICEVKAPTLYAAILAVKGRYGDSVTIRTTKCGVKLESI